MRILEWYLNLKLFWRIFLVIEAVNLLTFAVFRFNLFCNHREKLVNLNFTEAVVPSETGQKILTVEIGGTMGVEECFDIFKPYCDDGDIVYLDRNRYGFSMNAQIEAVLEYAEKNDYDKVRCIGISVGDYASQVIQNDFEGETTSLAVNPEPTHKVLKPGSRLASFGGGLLCEVINHGLLGWLSVIEWVPKSDQYFSLAYMADQFLCIAAGDVPPVGNNTIEVILSRDDQFLENERIRGLPYFTYLDQKENFHMVESDHGNTIDRADAYMVALKKIFARHPEW